MLSGIGWPSNPVTATGLTVGASGLTVTSSVVLALLVLPLLLTTVAVAVSVKLTSLTVVMVNLDRFQPLTSTDVVAPAVNLWVPSLSVSPTGIALTTSDCSVPPVKLFTVADSVPSGIAVPPVPGVVAAHLTVGASGLTVTSSVVLAVLVLPLLLTTVAVAVSVKLTSLTVV